jgi:hypothetical protein
MKDKTHYRLALQTIGKGLCIFFRSWGVTLDKLLHDILHGIRHHWLFAVTLVMIYVVMFVTMAQSRAQYHHTCMVNYQLSQSVDSLKIMTQR